MSDLRNMRPGDMILPASGMHPYEVTDVERLAGKVKARPTRGGRVKTFRADRLEEVDTGLWQECER